MNSLGKGLEPEDRPASQQERELIRWLLEHGEAGSQAEYLKQIERVRVIGRCNCGCPTVYFSTDGKPSTRKGEMILSDYCASVDEQEVGVMLFVNEGYLSSLEVYSCAGHDKPFGLPQIDSLYSYEDMATRVKPRP